MRLKERFIIAWVLVALPGWVVAQFSPEHAAMNNLAKGKWEKARSQLAKAIRKDSINTGAHYALSRYFFTPANPGFQIDSAYRYALQASSDYNATTAKQRDRFRKIPLDSIILVRHRERIDSAAFERAKAKNTEAAYIDFLNRFRFAAQHAQAIELRDEVAFLDALKENTYSAFSEFLKKYPEAARAPEARTRYERLLFEAKTKDKKLASYESFLREYSATPYRKEIERQIFEISTASGDPVDFDKFLKKYPQSSKATTAKNILYHLIKNEEHPVVHIERNDSIRALELLEESYLVPYLKDDSVGFMDQQGEEIIKAVTAKIPDEYLCGNIQDEWLALENTIIARNGAVIYRGEFLEAEEPGYGFMIVSSPSCTRVIHVSGFKITEECVQDARLLRKNYLALQKDKRWSVWTLTGRRLTGYEWDDIQASGDVLIFHKGNKLKLARLKDMARIADQGSPIFTQEYDEVKNWPNGKFWVRSGKTQSILTPDLKEWIKPEVHEITPTFFGALGQTSIGFTIYDAAGTPSGKFFRVKVNQPWVAVQHEGSWQLIDPVTRQFESPAFDTIVFNGPFSVGMKGDSLQIYFSKNTFIEIPKLLRTRFLPGKDSLFFLLIEDADKKTVYDARGKLLFTAIFDRIEYNNEGFFTVTRNGKLGVVGMDGKIIAPCQYDALGSASKGMMQTLRDKKFGLLDVIRYKEINAEYDKNIMPYNESKMIACRNGLCGLIGWDNKPITAFDFEEIQYWNDSTALLKKNFSWTIYNFVEKKIVLDKIRKLIDVRNTDQEKIMIVQQENNYGVISNRKGIIIPGTFTDIVNLGSSFVPLYFTEKHVEEASIYVVIYYDHRGKQLRRQVFEADDYERIYCHGN